MRPPATVVAEFGTPGAFFKPLDMAPEALLWQESVLATLAVEDVRVVAPLRSRSGELVVDGWTAWPFLQGEHAPRWPEIMAAGERLHRALEPVPRPARVLDAREDPWAVADRIAWGERPAPDSVRALAEARTAVDLPSQLIHGDLSGNVLFAPGLPPAVIDFSPYWRPAAYASAIVAVDAVLWHGEPLDLLEGHDRQLLIGALLFRLLAARDRASLERDARPVREYVLRG